MEAGTVAEWVGSLASIAAAIVSALALFVAVRANAHAREANETSRETRNDYLATAERERRMMTASLFQAWWVASDDGRWAVMISNGSSSAGVFRDIVLTSVDRGRTYTTPIPMLPPGTYVLEPEANGQGIPRLVGVGERWNPLTRSRKHAVQSLEFMDPLGERWRWDATNGLRPE